MKKRWFLVGGIFLLVSLLLIGCEEVGWVSKEDYAAVLAERDAAQAQVSELASSLEEAEAELEATKAESSELTSSLEKTQSQLQTTKSEYDSFKTEAKRLWTSLDAYLELNHYVLGINAELLREDLDEVHEGCLLMTARLATLGDSELQALWEPAYVVEAEEWNLYFDPFYVFMEKHALRISSKAQAIRDKLAE